MLSNFMNKPLGIATILGLAVGTPYAAFETELGTNIRTAATRMIGAQLPSRSNEVNNNLTANPSDPYSLTSANGGAWNGTMAPQSPWSNGTPSVDPNMGMVPGVANYGYPAGSYPMAAPIPNAVLDPAMLGVGGAVPIYPPYLESQRGSTSLVGGRTDQLWNNTLGTPSIAQVQQQPGANIGGGNVQDLREVLRFDITSGWITQRFARVSTVLSNVKLDGLRVPLVTGTRPVDLAGTMTYYFDASQTMRRIHVHALTGDPTWISQLIVQFYQLTPEQSLGGQLFTTRWNNRVTSMMQVSPAPVIYAGADHSKFIVFLELNQPSLDYGLSEEASELLRQSQAAQRW